MSTCRLDNASLDTAVQALKGAPYGPVRLGIAKPVVVDVDPERAESSAVANAEDASMAGADNNYQSLTDTKISEVLDYSDNTQEGSNISDLRTDPICVTRDIYSFLFSNNSYNFDNDHIFFSRATRYGCEATLTRRENRLPLRRPWRQRRR